MYLEMMLCDVIYSVDLSWCCNVSSSYNLDMFLSMYSADALIQQNINVCLKLLQVCKYLASYHDNRPRDHR